MPRRAPSNHDHDIEATSARRLTVTGLVAIVLAIAVAGCGSAALADAEGPLASVAGIASPITSTAPTPTVTPVPATTAPMASTVPPVATPVPAPTDDDARAQTDEVRDEPLPARRLRGPVHLRVVRRREPPDGAQHGDRRHETSRASQKALWKMARDRSFSPFGGANPRGWTATLNDLGIGPYVLVSIPTFDEALHVAAEAIRATKRPVGLVMWRGRHAWVMSGFESTGDPQAARRRRRDRHPRPRPALPARQPAGARSPKPNELLKPAELARQFVVRDTSLSRTDLGVPTGYLLVLPTVAEG